MQLRLVSSTMIVVSLLASNVTAQQPAACQTPEHRQFDFWTGEWEVFNPQGARVGSNTITPIEGGCVLHERWEGASGGTGQSFNIYDLRSGQWHQSWVSSNGLLLQLDGGLDEEGRMVLRGETMAQGGGIVHHEIMWSPVHADTVRQRWRQSQDSGESWNIAFNGTYVRRAKAKD